MIPPVGTMVFVDFKHKGKVEKPASRVWIVRILDDNTCLVTNDAHHTNKVTADQILGLAYSDDPWFVTLEFASQVPITQ